MSHPVVERFFHRWMELNPVEATRHGLHELDGRLPDGGLAAARERERLLAGFASELRRAVAGPEVDVARYYADLALHRERVLRPWARMALAPDAIGSGILLLLARGPAPPAERLEAIAARLEAVPGYLRASRECLVEPVALWNRAAAETARGLPELFAAAVSMARGPLRGRLEAAAVEASLAADRFADWLERAIVPLAEDRWALGADDFAELIALRRLPAGPEAIRDLGRSLLAEAREEWRATLSRNWPGRPVPDVLDEVIVEAAPTFEAVLDRYRETIARLRDHVSARGLATLPGGEELRVIETPGHLRPTIPYALYEGPAFFDVGQAGTYLVTRPAGSLRRHNRATIVSTSAHEAYPGHHLQAVIANRSGSLARLLASEFAVEFVEGWAHYCEDLVAETGLAEDPVARLVALGGQIWRACRTIIDVELSSGRMTFEEAVRMLREEAMLSRPGAEAEVRRYTYTPGYQLSYLYGKHLLRELRARRARAEGPAFDLGRFHDRLLAGGPVPAPMLDRLFPDAGASDGG